MNTTNKIPIPEWEQATITVFTILFWTMILILVLAGIKWAWGLLF